MKRFYLVAVAGLCSCVPLSAQEGSLAPTAPVVPAPVLQNGSVLTPAGGGGWGAGSPRVLPISKWSPFRNPATASTIEPTAPYASPMPPLPAGVGGADGSCGAGSCGVGGCGGRERLGWDRIKAFLTYHPTKTELPKLRPTPYVTPLQGLFPCSSAASCGTGCANGSCGSGQPVYGQPQQPYTQPQGHPMPMPMPAPGGAGAVVMPPRGTQGTVQNAALQPTWQGRTSAPANPGIAGYRFAAPESQPANGPVVNTAFKYPTPR